MRHGGGQEAGLFNQKRGCITETYILKKVTYRVLDKDTPGWY